MSRGRGGARGGRGAANRSFNREQLSAMGVNLNEMPTLVTQPPPLYPPLERKPIQLEINQEKEYLLTLRQDFIDHIHLNYSYLDMMDKTRLEGKEIDILVAQFPQSKEKYDWSLFPTELRSKATIRREKRKLDKEVDVNVKLERLEELEKKVKVPKQEVQEVNEEEEVMEEEDEEMDDGTDYANNYFDNGEGYEDEDDNMDDGPIY